MGDRQAELQQQQRALQQIIDTQRVAVDLNKDQQIAGVNMNMSVEATQRDLAYIDQAFMTRDLQLSEEMRNQLTNAYGRGQAHLLINSHKTLGDSRQMKAVKEGILEVERLLNEPVTKIDIALFDNLRTAYDTAIKSCFKYCDRKPSRFAKGQERRAQVESNMNRLMREAARLDEVRALFERGVLQDGIHRPSDLIFMGQIHDFAVNFGQVQTVRQMQQPGAGADQAAPVKKTRQDKKNDASIQKVLKALTVPEEKWSSGKKRVADESGKLRRFLAEFPSTGLHSAYIQLDGQLVNFMQDDSGHLVISVGSSSYNVPESVRILRERMESRMIERNDEMNASDITEIIDAQVAVHGGDVVQIRTLCARYIELKTGEAATTFNNLDTQALRMVARFLSQGGDVKQAIEAAKSLDTALLINGVETLDIVARAQKAKELVKEKIVYTQEETRAQLQAEGKVQELQALEEEELHGWTKEESALKDFVSDLIFSYETWDSDETLAQPGDRILRVITKNTGLLSKLFVDMSKSGPNNPDMLKTLLDKMPLESMGMDPAQVYGQVKGVVDSVNQQIDAGIAQSVKEMSDGGVPKWLLDKAVPKMTQRIENMRSDPELIKEYLDKGISTGFIKDQIREKAIAVENEIDNYVAEASQMVQSKIVDSVGSIFGNGQTQDQAQDQAATQVQAQPQTQTREPIPSPDDTSDPVEKKRRIKLGAERLNQMLEDSVKGEAGQGLFVKETFKNYFAGVSIMDKRAMFASAFRNARPKQEYPEEIQRGMGPLTQEMQAQLDAQITERDKKIEQIDRAAMGNFLGGLLKGAGPLFQKMLQGLPIDSMPPEIKGAMEDVKSKLAPIPREIVDAQLLGMVERSGGKITKIKVDRALGAASVGQTFLCKFYGPDLPEEGKDVVVKLLKPDVRNRMMREKAVLLSCARSTDNIQRTRKGMPVLKADEKGGMEATYEGQLSRIEEELDLSIEARNVVKGALYDKPMEKGLESDGVKSMKLDDLVAPTVNSMVLEKAKGTTLDRYMKDVDKRIQELMGDLYKKNPDGSVMLQGGHPVLIDAANQMEEGYKIQTAREELHKELERLLKRHEYMSTLAEKWVNEGIFKEGFYHGDLHAGNIMIDDDGATLIDFGNATALDEKQRVNVTLMVGAAAVGDVDGFIEGLHNLLDKEFEGDFKSAQADLKTGLKEIFSLGDSNCAGQRIALALLKAQELRLQVPAAIFNFSQSQLRLQNAMESMERQIKELKGNLAAMEGIVVPGSAYLDPEVLNGNAFHDSGRLDRESENNLNWHLRHEAEICSALIDEYDYEDEKCADRYVHAEKVSPVFKSLQQSYEGISRAVLASFNVMKNKPDDSKSFEAALMVMERAISDFGRCMEVQDLQLKGEKLLRDARQAVQNNDPAAEETFSRGFEEIRTAIGARLEPGLKVGEKLRAYDALKKDPKAKEADKKKALNELAEAYKPLHKFRFSTASVNSSIRQYLRGDGSSPEVAEGVNKELEGIMARDEVLGPQLRQALTEYNALKADRYNNLDAFVAKENEVMELMRKISVNRWKRIRDLSSANASTHPRDFIEVMGKTITEHLRSALGRLGVVRSVTYGMKLNQ